MAKDLDGKLILRLIWDMLEFSCLFMGLLGGLVYISTISTDKYILPISVIVLLVWLIRRIWTCIDMLVEELL